MSNIPDILEITEVVLRNQHHTALLNGVNEFAEDIKESLQYILDNKCLPTGNAREVPATLLKETRKYGESKYAGRTTLDAWDEYGKPSDEQGDGLHYTGTKYFNGINVEYLKLFYAQDWNIMCAFLDSNCLVSEDYSNDTTYVCISGDGWLLEERW